MGRCEHLGGKDFIDPDLDTLGGKAPQKTNEIGGSANEQKDGGNDYMNITENSFGKNAPKELDKEVGS